MDTAPQYLPSSLGNHAKSWVIHRTCVAGESSKSKKLRADGCLYTRKMREGSHPIEESVSQHIRLALPYLSTSVFCFLLFCQPYSRPAYGLSGNIHFFFINLEHYLTQGLLVTLEFETTFWYKYVKTFFKNNYLISFHSLQEMKCFLIQSSFILLNVWLCVSQKAAYFFK